MRGSAMKAAAETNKMPVQRPPSKCHEEMREASMAAKVSETPPMSHQTTYAPTINNAASLTTASSAIAVTTPWCLSLASRFRVPKMTVKTASPTATQKAVACLSKNVPSVAETSINALNESDTDCSCSAIYGVVPITANIVTIMAMVFDFP